MKKILSLLLCLSLLMGTAAALAETTLNGGEARNIQINKADLNDEEPGISPVTGRTLDDLYDQYRDGFAGQAFTGRYLPIIVQIDNADGGIGYDTSTGKATGNRAPWGAQYTDIIYETALYKDGQTRLSFLFSDIIPDEVGPIRSARMFHAKLREEWDCAFSFYGQQMYAATNVPAFFRETGAENKGVLFSGTVGTNKPWKQYYYIFSKKKLAAPHDKGVNAAALVSLVPPEFEAPNHAFLFTDDLPEDGDDAEEIYVNWAHGDLNIYNSLLEWDEDDECYYRYMSDKKGKFTEYKTLQAGDDESVSIPINNIIVQFVNMEWVRTDAPNPTVLGTGNADYFMGGKHMAGVWNRDTLSDRTVFYGEDGEEIELQRGRTLIIVMDYEFDHRSVSYE